MRRAPIGDGPDLKNMFVDDQDFQGLIKQCGDSVEQGFNAAKIYSDTFDEFHQFYVENENTNIDALKTEPHGTFFWNISKKSSFVHRCGILC